MDQADAATALVVREQRQIEVLGDQILAVQTVTGDIFIPFRLLCDLLGLSRPAQVRRIQRDDELRPDLQEIILTTPGGSQTIQALRVDVVPFWLAGVTVSKVKPELQDKIRAYRRWVVRKVYEAFLAELSEPPAVAGGETSPSATLAALIQVRDMGRAITQMAEAQMALEQRQGVTEARLDQAAGVVGDIRRRLLQVEARLDPHNIVTATEAATISAQVKALGLLLTERDPSKNHFGGIFSELYRRCGVTEYRSIRRDQYEEVLQFLADWRNRLLTAHRTGSQAP